MRSTGVIDSNQILYIDFLGDLQVVICLKEYEISLEVLKGWGPWGAKFELVLLYRIDFSLVL